MRTLNGMRPGAAKTRGFTLIEVMVALFVTAVGLLGIAKIQALAYASTGSASVRSLVALQAAGLAASMHANRNFWALGLAPIPVTVSGAVIVGGSLGTPTDCTFTGGATPCTATSVAAYDLQQYAASIDTMLSNSSPVTTINCPIPGVVNTPITCTIQITWNEKAVSVNSQGATATTGSTFTPTYTLFVEP